MTDNNLLLYWHEIPSEESEAKDYDTLCIEWNVSKRRVRRILHELSYFDNGDGFILLRSCRKKGFYKTNDIQTIKQYRQECLNKGKSVFAPLRKIDRILNIDSAQVDMVNNLRMRREMAGLLQSEVVFWLRMTDESFDIPMLSKMENGLCLPTPIQRKALAHLYGCSPDELVRYDL